MDSSRLSTTIASVFMAMLWLPNNTTRAKSYWLACCYNSVYSFTRFNSVLFGQLKFDNTLSNRFPLG